MFHDDKARTAEQNAKLHAMCRDFAKQMTWAGTRLDEEQWKRLFLGAKCGQIVGQNPFTHGIVVVNAKRSRELGVAEMAELLGEIEAYGNTNGIDWTEDEE